MYVGGIINNFIFLKNLLLKFFFFFNYSKLFKLFLLSPLVYKLKEIFININEIKNYTPVNVIVKILSTEILIRKTINPGSMSGPGEELLLLQVCIADDTGTMNAIFKNENIKFMKIGEEVIIRNAKIEVINGNIILISDENSNIFPSKGIIDLNSMPMEMLELNYSKIKLQMRQFDNL